MLWNVAVLAASVVSSRLPFSKYHGIGNDFILVDNRQSPELVLSAAQAAQLCDRNFGIGANGVIFALAADDADYAMRIINSDGSEPEMCGNGIRCMAKFIQELEGETAPRAYTISTLAGPMVPEVLADGQVAVDMGEPILEGAKVPTLLSTNEEGRVIDAPLEVAGRSWQVTCVSMGNPHAVVFVDSVADFPLAEIGPQFEKHPMFPARINTEFVEVCSPSHLKMCVWERGAGPTLACGTGACALLVAAVLTGRASRDCTVDLPGGSLHISWREEDNRLIMTGPAELVFAGEAAVADV